LVHIAVDQRLSVAYASPEAADLLGKSPEACVGSNLLNCFPPDLAERLRRACDWVLAQKAPIVIETEWPGTECGLRVQIAPAPNGFSIYFSAELPSRDLQVVEDRYRALSRATTSIVWTTTPDGHIVDAPEWRTATGQTGEGARGLGWLDAIHPEDRPRAERQWLRAVESLLPYSAEFRLRMANGDYRWHKDRGIPVVEEDGRVREWVGLCEDVHDQTLAETERDRFFQTGVDLMVVAGFDGYFKKVSPKWTETLGWSAEELTSRPWLHFVHPDDREQTVEEGRKLQQGHEVLSFENRYLTKGGAYRWISWRVRPFMDEGVLYGSASDVTERKLAEEALRAENERYAQVIAAEQTILAAEGGYDAVLSVVLDQVQRLTGADGACLEILDGDDLVYEGACGLAETYSGMRMRVAGSLSGLVVKSGVSARSDDVVRDRRVNQEACRRAGLRSMLIVPLRYDQGRFGVLEVMSSRPHAFSEGDQRTLELLSGFLGATIGRKRVEEALQRSDEQYRATFDRAAVGIAHVGLDGRWLRFNQALCDYLGYSPEELREKTFGDITHEDDLESDWEQARRLAAGVIDTYTMDKRYIRKDGSVMWVNLTASMLRDPDGQPLHYIAIVEDITQRREVEQSLRESEDHFRFMVDSIPQVPWTANPEGRLTDISDRWLWMTGLPKEEALDAGWQQVAHPDDLAKMSKSWKHCLETGAPFEAEHRIRMADGTHRWVRSRAVARRNEEGQIVRWYGSTEDIQVQKLVEGELERQVDERTAELSRARDAALAASKAKSEFLANVSHEIRTPMNGVIGMTSLLLQRNLDSRTREMVETIATSGETLLRVLDDVLDLSKIEAGRLEIERAPVDLGQLVTDVGALYQGHAQAKGIALRSVPPPSPAPAVLADSLRLRQVLANLVANGVKFTDRGEVSLAWTWEPDADGFRVVFKVSDTGIGIPSDRLDAVFQSFTQADGSTHRRFGGTGLGLTIAKHLVESMGGRIFVTSEVGVGTSFTVDLPFEAAELGEEAGTSPPAEAREPVERATRVLLAEDNPVNVMVAKLILEQCGCTVDVAENGMRAIAMAAAESYDLVMMDVQMPICDGLEATRAIRQTEEQEGRRRLPIYALTANAMGEDREACLAAGMDGFIPKPVRIPDIEQALENAARANAEA
jgi:PAS domain S-box-containing protein